MDEETRTKATGTVILSGEKIERRIGEARKEVLLDAKKGERGKEEPIKAHDHFPDAGRYYINTRINDWRLAA